MGTSQQGTEDVDDASTVAMGSSLREAVAEDDNPWGDMGDDDVSEGSRPVIFSPTSRTASRYFEEATDEETYHDPPY